MNNPVLTYYGHNRRIPKDMRCDRMSFHELTLIISGSMTYTVDGERYELGAKSAMFIPAGYERERSAGVECDYVSFNFTSDEIPDLPICISDACHSEIVLLIEAIDRIATKPQLPLYERAAELLSVILLLLSDYAKAEKMTPLTISILGYLHRNFKGKVTLADLSDAFFFSGGYCEAVFSRDMGRSVIDYVLDLRISEAQRLMLDSSLSLSVIAAEVGFPDYNYFSRVFRRRVGIAPKDYVRLHKA